MSQCYECRGAYFDITCPKCHSFHRHYHYAPGCNFIFGCACGFTSRSLPNSAFGLPELPFGIDGEYPICDVCGREIVPGQDMEYCEACGVEFHSPCLPAHEAVCIS